MPATQIVTFCLGDDTFAVDVFCVERVIEYQRPKAIPNVPDWIEGVIEYQSRVVPTISLRRRFELPDTTAPALPRIMVFTVGSEWVAAVVDFVQEVRTVDSATISPPPQVFHGLPCEYLRGIVRDGERLTIYLDIGRILSTNEQIMLREIAHGSPGA